MSLTLASVLNDSHYALSAWQTDQSKVLAYMTQFNTDNDLIAYLQANKNNAAVVGGLTTDFPQWGVSAMGDQVGASAAYLNTELAPIIIEAAAMGWDSAHLTNAIQQTPYYQAHNQTQLQWQTKSPADKDASIGQLATQIADTYRQEFGVQAPTDINVYRGLAEAVASGTEDINYVNYQVRQLAEASPNTPAAQNVTALQRQAGQQATDISNLTQQLGDTWRQWMGDQYPPQDLAGWAQKINMNQASMADFLNTAKTMSAQLYANKPANLDYASWIQQPKSVIGGTLELPSVKDSDLLLQSYVRGNIANLGDLKLAAQQDPRYDATVTARDQATQLGSHLLSTWGLASGPGL
jgi:hypothetical protein